MMPGAVKVHHLPLALGDASLQRAGRFEQKESFDGTLTHIGLDPDEPTHLDVRKLDQVGVHAAHRLVRDVLVVIQPQSVRVLETRQDSGIKHRF